MTSLFQTATGSWHIPSILLAASWLIGSLVTGGFMFANLRVNRDDRITAFQRQQQADALLAEAHSKIEALQPKSLKVRLIDFLNSVDRTILQDLASGTTHFRGNFTTSQAADIERLSSEPEAAVFIQFRAEPIVSAAAGVGMVTVGSFDLDPSLLKP